MTSNQPLEQQLMHLLTGGGLTIAAAESCSGGLVASRITSVAGSSEYFLGSVVAYSNDMKQSVLNVPASILEQRGAVSAECAAAMAEGVRNLTGATLTVSTTGIAGPGGATARKPVGLVYFGCASPSGTETHEVHWTGDRAAIMDHAAAFALQLICDTARAHLSRQIQRSTDL
jgi:PncC family amidohydrolase